jgi:hypothetical protein
MEALVLAISHGKVATVDVSADEALDVTTEDAVAD